MCGEGRSTHPIRPASGRARARVFTLVAPSLTIGRTGLCVNMVGGRWGGVAPTVCVEAAREQRKKERGRPLFEESPIRETTRRLRASLTFRAGAPLCRGRRQPCAPPPSRHPRHHHSCRRHLVEHQARQHRWVCADARRWRASSAPRAAFADASATASHRPDAPHRQCIGRRFALVPGIGGGGTRGWRGAGQLGGRRARRRGRAPRGVVREPAG